MTFDLDIWLAGSAWSGSSLKVKVIGQSSGSRR